MLSLFLGSWGDYALHTTTALWAGHTCNHMRKHKHMHPHRETHCISMSTHMHTHTHTYTLTHTHACTHKSTHKNPKLHREKNLLRTFIGFRKRRTTLPFTWSPAVYTPRGMSKRISKISNFIMKSACTHTPRTEHTVFTLKQVIHNFFFNALSTRVVISGLKHISSEHNKC